MSGPQVAPLNRPNAAESAISIGVLPDVGAPLAMGCKFVLVGTAGNMGVVMADGSDNDANLVAVTPGMIFPISAVSCSTSNTAGLLALF